MDQKFVGRTFVAVTGDGLDPCDLRLQRGDEAVRDLVAARIPLVEFVLRSRIDGFDLDTAEGRTNALRSAAPVVAAISDRILRSEYVRLLSGWTGLEQAVVGDAVRGAGSSHAQAPPRRSSSQPSDPATQVEREALKLALQSPELVHTWWGSIQADAFTNAECRIVFEALQATGELPSQTDPSWIPRVLEACPDDEVRTRVRALAVELPRTLFGDTQVSVDVAFAENVLSRLLELDASRRLREAKSRLQRINPVDSADEYRRLFADVLALEQYRRELREYLVGEA
ncbi:MAG: hypothetical protein V9G10_17725 [Candidatus Nanopelagicales bacterium]